jgi:uncharacterized phage-associated protein
MIRTGAMKNTARSVRRGSGIDLILSYNHVRGIICTGHTALVKFARAVYNKIRRTDGNPVFGRDTLRERGVQKWQKTIQAPQEVKMTHPISVFSAARYLCSKCDWKISNLELQKMLYISQMIYMGSNDGARLCDTQFQAWDYGPVSPELYSKVKAFGSNYAEEITDNKMLECLDAIAMHFGCGSAAKLVSMTHWNGGAWYKNYVSRIKGIVISDNDIMDEYQARARATSKAAA